MGSSTYQRSRYRLSCFFISTFVAGCLFFSTACRVQATDWVEPVSSLSDLQNALNTICIPGDTLTININPNTYTTSSSPMSLDSLLVVDSFCDTVTLNGSGSGSTFLNGNGTYRVIDVRSPAWVTINNVTIENGLVNGFGAGIFVGPGSSTVNINNSVISGNHAQASGGGIALAVGTTVNISDSTISNNTADFNGGGIFNFGGYVVIDSSSFSENSANPSNDPAALGGNDILNQIGVIVSPVTDHIINESGAPGTTTFSVRLNQQPPPGKTITIGVASTDTSEVDISPATLTFTDGNFNIDQTVTITAVNDDVDDDNQTFNIVLTDNTLAGLGLDGNFEIAAVPVTTVDDDVAGITVGPISGHTTEDGGLATFTVVLTSEPVAEVAISLNSSNILEGIVSPDQLSFDNTDWNLAKTVTVTGVGDDLCDGDQSFVIITAPASSTDLKYAGMDPIDVDVVNEHTFKDRDGDNWEDCADNCPDAANPGQVDSDADGFGDACDLCPGYDDNLDADGDGIPNCNDGDDTDGDGFTDAEEALCGSDPIDSNSTCVKGLPWLILLLDD